MFKRILCNFRNFRNWNYIGVFYSYILGYFHNNNKCIIWSKLCGRKFMVVISVDFWKLREIYCFICNERLLYVMIEIKRISPKNQPAIIHRHIMQTAGRNVPLHGKLRWYCKRLSKITPCLSLKGNAASQNKATKQRPAHFLRDKR